MPKTRRTKSRGRGGGGNRPQYKEDSSEDENMFNIGRLRNFFDFLVQHNTPNKRRRTAAGRGSKRQFSADLDDNEPNCGRCSCSHHKSSTKKPTKRTAASKAKTNKCGASTSTATNVIDSDSEEEINPGVTDTQKDSITKKVDTFFKRFESDDDEDDLKPAKPATTPEKKSKEFYLFNSDSEEDSKTTQKVPPEPDVTSKPSTSAGITIGNIVTSGLKLLTKSVPAVKPDKKVEDLFAYVDEIMKECDEVIDLEDDKPKENIPELSLIDLKKKTAEILASVETEAENLKGSFNLKAKETLKTTEDLSKEAPSCPVCLEQLGGARQAMSTLCGHMFCEPCLSQVIKSTKSCPSCRKKLNKKSMYHPIYI